MVQEVQIIIALCLIAAGGAATAWIIRKYLRKWMLVSVKGDFTLEHHLPDTIPVPRTESVRVDKGDFTFDEAVAWMRQFVHERKRHRMRNECEVVLRKYELYRQLGEKMGRGLWRDVDSLAQRLAEIDPLDPSAAVARGRAMRELGNFPKAIRYYQRALELTPFHSTAFPEMAATCRAINQPGRFRAALDKASYELGETHPLTIEGRIQLGELVRVYADPTDPATLAHIPREQYLQNMVARLEDMPMDQAECLRIGQAMLSDDMPELADELVHRCEHEFGECGESLLLQGMTAHYRMNNAKAIRLIRESIAVEDTGFARQELALVLRDESLRIPEENPKRKRLAIKANHELRLAIDRDENLISAIAMLADPAWNGGLKEVLAKLEPLSRIYPQSWAVWRVIGDAYATDDKARKAVESYRRGLKIEMADELLLPCLTEMERLAMRQEMLDLATHIPELDYRDPQLRWKVAQILCDHEKFSPARKLLQAIVDDDHIAPPLRQRADDVLDQLDEIERRQFKKKQKRRDQSA